MRYPTTSAALLALVASHASASPTLAGRGLLDPIFGGGGGGDGGSGDQAPSSSATPPPSSPTPPPNNPPPPPQQPPPSGSYQLQDLWQGSNFFSGWSFFTNSDPTHGIVTYVSQSTAQANNLAYTTSSGTTVMKVDSTTDLPKGAHRNSVRITSNKAYEGGLFVLDAARFPYGCAVWPAFWMIGPNWPQNGEVDIFENINGATQNQYTAHTTANCSIDANPSPSAYSGYQVSSSRVGPTSCAPSPKNTGCYFVDNDSNTAGAGLNGQGGGVFVMEWKEEGIRIWQFHRSSIPSDITSGSPDPSSWSSASLKASWPASTCSPAQHFHQMRMVFDITLCGDYAGNNYGKSGCPGDCASQVMKGSNFANAAWEVNYVAVYESS